MPSQVRASHILVDSEAEAKRLLNMIRAGKKFEKLAKKHSKCPSGKKGGDLGYFGRGMMVPEFDNVVFTMNKGEVSSPVKTQFGYHLIMVVDRR